MKASPIISVIIPTLNSAGVLDQCLKSIFEQDYPGKRIEVIVVDGGSVDGTVRIAKKFQVKIFSNPLKTGEAGKAVGLRWARGELVAFIDSDNILPTRDWFSQMIGPFEDKEILLSEPMQFTYRPTDPALTRYFALLGANDPLCYFLGNYDRLNILSGTWTGFGFGQIDKGDYLKVKLDRLPLPTIGANGTVYRRKSLPDIKDYFFDIDIPVKIFQTLGPFYIAKVKTGIVHLYAEDLLEFFHKQLRRVSDFSAFSKGGLRATDWEKTYFWRIMWFQVQCLTVIPIVWQTLYGVVKTRDPAWFFHLVTVYSTWFIYLYGWIGGKIGPNEKT